MKDGIHEIRSVLDDIARAVGCPQWDYPGQLVRDVEALTARIAELEASTSTEREFRESLQRCQQTTCDRSPPPYCDRHNPRIAELEAENERLRGAGDRALRALLRGHAYEGSCPDAIEGWASRDSNCQACVAMVDLERALAAPQSKQ